MTKSANKRAEKANKRIETIKVNLKAHRKNIILLTEYYLGKRTFKSEDDAPKVETYYCIPKCEKRYRWTCDNITAQITLLELELAILIEYGARSEVLT